VDDEGVQVQVVPPKRIRLRRLLSIGSHVPGLACLKEAYAGWDLVENSRGAWHAIRCVNQVKPLDLIEVADYSGLGFWGLVRSRHAVPILVRGHGMLGIKPSDQQWLGADFQLALERFAARHADYVLTNSHYMAEAYRREFGVPSVRVGVHPLPFLDSPADPSGRDIRQEMGWAEDDPIVLFVGRLEKRKGIDIFLQAVTDAHRKFPALRVVLLGELGDCPKSLYDEFMAQGTGWAFHPGAVDSTAVRSIMLQSNLLALPSRFEPLGRVLIEAQLAGLPVVGTRVGGIPEALVEGVTGLLVESEDINALSHAITTLCQNPGMRTEMGRGAVAWAAARFDITHVMSTQVKVYRALHERKSPAKLLHQEVC
jgi:glycosyltransferase involved in cell wall biosynthesis